MRHYGQPYTVSLQQSVEARVCSKLICHVKRVASRPRFGGDSQVHSWYRPAGERPSWVGTSWKGSAGQGPAISDETGTRPKGFSYVYKYQPATQVE
jgi:hypothetical protein